MTEAVSNGTTVGPFMTDLTGYPELTPYKAAGAATTSTRARWSSY
jgi:hypothetical protein